MASMLGWHVSVKASATTVRDAESSACGSGWMRRMRRNSGLSSTTSEVCSAKAIAAMHAASDSCSFRNFFIFLNAATMLRST